MSWPAGARATQVGSAYFFSQNVVIARPPGPREARPEDKLHVRATHGRSLDNSPWVARIKRAMTN
jgi:hypothetical protein